MAEQNPIKVLVLGATGYIGGSIVAQFNREDPNASYLLKLSALVRKPEQADKLNEVGVRGTLFKGLDDFDAIKDAAKESDIVVAAASARHEGAAKACIEGLAESAKASGKDVHYLHISGTSMIGDWPESGERVDDRIYNDQLDDIYAIEKEFPDNYSPVRVVDQLVVDLGEKSGVKTYIVPAPLIFGPGLGLFSKGFGQIHMMAQLALKKKQAVQIGSGAGIWNRIDIKDLTMIFAYIVDAILTNKEIPSGRAGYYFAESGFQSWRSIAEAIGKVGYEVGAFESSKVGSISLKEAGDELFGGDLRDAEAVLASNSRTRASKARNLLDWVPNSGQPQFEEEIRDVVLSMSKEST